MHAPDRDQHYDYAVIRVVPRVEREEFLNVGIILSCESSNYLQAQIELDERRLLALAPGIDLESLRSHLQAITEISRGGPGSGPIGLLPQRARFHWLTASRSSIIQTSPVHMGKCGDMPAIMEHLLQRMVRAQV